VFPAIPNLKHYNTPVIEGIVQPGSDTGYRMDRLPDHEHYNRDRHGFSYPSEPSEGNRGGCDHNRCGYVRRSQGLITTAGPGQNRGFGAISSRASFPMLQRRCCDET